MTTQRTPRKKRFKSVSIFWLLPNALTVSGLVSGLTALRFAMDGRWAGVIVLIAVAAVFDALDGRTARKFQTQSAFGAALDSLSDLVVFGVVPALCLYLWALQGAGNLAWGATLFYAVSIALRLARFDSEIPDPPDYAKNYFTGIPAPASGFLVLMPVVLDLQFGVPVAKDATIVSLWLLVVGIGAVSAMPTFAGKRIKLPVESVVPLLAVIGVVGAAIVTEPWITYMVVTVLYILTLPLSIMRFLRDRRQFENGDS